MNKQPYALPRGKLLKLIGITGGALTLAACTPVAQAPAGGRERSRPGP
jgi:hypothetical protein